MCCSGYSLGSCNCGQTHTHTRIYTHAYTQLKMCTVSSKWGWIFVTSTVCKCFLLLFDFKQLAYYNLLVFRDTRTINKKMWLCVFSLERRGSEKCGIISRMKLARRGVDTNEVRQMLRTCAVDNDKETGELKKILANSYRIRGALTVTKGQTSKRWQNEQKEQRNEQKTDR